MLCDSPNYKLGSESSYDEMPISPNLKLKQINDFVNTDSSAGLQKSKSGHKMHPNIHHHPTIHPHKKNQRPINLMASNTNKIVSNTNNCNVNSNNNNHQNNNNKISNENLITITDNINDSEIQRKIKEADDQIERRQKLINDLNYEIFTNNPSNFTRPPSEYLDIYNMITEELHFWQEKKEILELELLNYEKESNKQEQNKIESENESNSESSPIKLNENNLENSNFDYNLIQNQKHKLNKINSTNTNNLPKFKLEYSNTLNGSLITPTTPTSPNLFPISPVDLNHTDTFSLPSSTSSASLQNQNLINHQNTMSNNSRSFGDINDFISNSQTPTLSPSSSLATTPTCNSIHSSFLRIFIGNSTAVVEKKPIQLKEALISKLKSRNLEIDKCIAYIKDSNLLIDWNIEMNKINADNIAVSEIGDEIRHSFEKKTFTLRSCDSCKKRFLLNVYACTKCYYVMCQRNECRAKTERIVCAARKINSSSSLVGSMHTLSKPEYDAFGRPESPIKDTSINISQQILPVNQLKVNIPSRDRSRSETELNIFVNPKLTIENNRPVPKSPTTLAKISGNKNSIYGTIPRNQPNIKSSVSTNIDDISGSVNEESGSVLSSIVKNGQNSDKLNKPKTETLSTTVSTGSAIHQSSEASKKQVRQNIPCRRDSFNSWQIPFKQIKIDQSKKIGSGSFGIVHKGYDFYHGEVAVKFLNVQDPTPNQRNAFRNEVAILKSTRHDNILLFIGCILDPILAIVTEWCPGSSLYKHIHVEEESWDMLQLVDIAKQTATGMEYLHATDILHRDLKSNNIFLIPKEPNNNLRHRFNQDVFDDFLNEQKWTVKIGDFGLATVKSTWTQTSVKTNQPTGSILWMAPEVIKQKVADPYTQKSDVYSYAVVLYELFTGHLPYQHKEQNMILFLVGSGRLKLNPDDCRNDTPNELKDLMITCSQHDRDKRFDFVEINEKLKQLKLNKSKLNKLKRAQSVPNVNFSLESSHMSGLSIFEDELYPTTPQLMLDMTESFNNILNNNSNNLNTSQLITNF